MANPRGIDNFDRHVWSMFGAAAGAAMGLFLPWEFTVGWFLGFWLPMLVVYGLVTGRITLHRKERDG